MDGSFNGGTIGSSDDTSRVLVCAGTAIGIGIGTIGNCSGMPMYSSCKVTKCKVTAFGCGTDPGGRLKFLGL